MNCKEEIENLAWIKIGEANCLFEHEFFDGAYYMGGYAIELLLKAKVCKTLGISDFFLFQKGSRPEAFKPYKVHDYEQLLILSGLYTDFQKALNEEKDFKIHWSIVSEWSEKYRYLTGKEKEELQNYLSSLTEIAKWIQKHL